LRTLLLNNNKIVRIVKNLEGGPQPRVSRRRAGWRLRARLTPDPAVAWAPAGSIPNLDTLVLTNNKLTELKVSARQCLLLASAAAVAAQTAQQLRQRSSSAPTAPGGVQPGRRAATQDLDPLASLSKLVRLSLVENPVTKKASYR
jgi:Leucine-rich repeat (LRR) protein